MLTGRSKVKDKGCKSWDEGGKKGAVMLENNVGQKLFDNYTHHPCADCYINQPVDPCTVTGGENLNLRGIKLQPQQVQLRLWWEPYSDPPPGIFYSFNGSSNGDLVMQ